MFGHDLGPDNFIKQILMTNPAGTLDTSFIATDYLNNPGTMNGIYNLPPPGRVAVAVPENISGGAADLKNLDMRRDDTTWWSTPRVLKEGADSVGLHGALSRVYLNIGEYWEQWTRNFKPLVGIKKQTPIRVKDAQKLSPAWNWSENARARSGRVPDQVREAAQARGCAGRQQVPHRRSEAARPREARLRSRTAPAAIPASGRRKASIRGRPRDAPGSNKQ